jgi:hypothetical protein
MINVFLRGIESVQCAYHWVKDLYAANYNRVAAAVFDDKEYTKVVRYSFKPKCIETVTYDKGWLLWLLPMYALKHGLGLDILEWSDTTGTDGPNDEASIYEFSRGKGIEYEVVLTRHPSIQKKELEKDQSIRIASATADDLISGNSLSLTHYIQQRQMSLNTTNNFTANEVLAIAKTALGYSDSEFGESKLSLLIEKIDCPTSLQHMYEENQFMGDDVVVLAQ